MIDLVRFCLLLPCLGFRRAHALPNDRPQIPEAALQRYDHHLNERDSNSKLVFCHFMIGIVSNRGSADDYDADMQRAQSYGIDAFALNIGTDPFTDSQLGYAYTSAKKNNMKVFLSFDFNWWSQSDAIAVGNKIAQYATGDYAAAQLMIDGKVFASTFSGDDTDPTKLPMLDAKAVKDTAKAAGVTDVYFAPNFHPGQGDFSTIDGALNWMGWPNDGNNKAPKPGASFTAADGDSKYTATLNGKGYIARKILFLGLQRRSC